MRGQGIEVDDGMDNCSGIHDSVQSLLIDGFEI
jgi:hypothetical protein